MGEYFITFKISDRAGNEAFYTTIVNVNPLSYFQTIPAFTPPAGSSLLPEGEGQSEGESAQSFGGEQNAPNENTQYKIEFISSAAAGGKYRTLSAAEEEMDRLVPVPPYAPPHAPTRSPLEKIVNFRSHNVKIAPMKTEILPAAEIQTALQLLQNGGIVAFPTDTVYGVGALAFDNAAIESIYAAKDRPPEKAIPILIGDLSDLEKVAEDIPDMALRFAARFWPGPLTCIVPKKLTLPPSVSATPTVAVRIPDHPDALALLRAAGPMAVTSANLSGQPSPSTAQEVYNQLNGRIPLILDGGRTPGGVPSTLVDCTGKAPVILREGPISLEDLLSVLR